MLNVEESANPGPKLTYFETRSKMYNALDVLSNPFCPYVGRVRKKR
jgi:hypothetical protein